MSELGSTTELSEFGAETVMYSQTALSLVGTKMVDPNDVTLLVEPPRHDLIGEPNLISG